MSMLPFLSREYHQHDRWQATGRQQACYLPSYLARASPEMGNGAPRRGNIIPQQIYPACYLGDAG